VDRDRRRHHKPPPSAEALAERALRDLSALVRAVAERRGHDADPDPLALTVRVGPRPPDRSAARDLLAAVEARLEAEARSTGAFLPGRVYCFLCESPDCAHARPDGPRASFAGYAPTGKPEWRDFVNRCIERGEPVETLFADRPGVIAFAQTGGELTGGLLPGFGREDSAYNVLGQVVAGLVPGELSGTGSERVALSLQIVETRLSGGHGLRLNLVGLDPAGLAAAAAGAPARAPAERLRRTVDVTRRRLRAIGRRVAAEAAGGRPPALDDTVRPLLTRLRGDLERIFRPASHRTLHARERHLSAERPTSSALDDARGATDDRLYDDARRGTLVVLGPRGRAHIFTREGRHVTSLKLEPGELARKTARGRWRLVKPGTAGPFRERVSRAP